MTPTAASLSRSPVRLGFALAVVGVLSGCSREGATEVTQVVERDDAGAPAPEATPEQRFRPRGGAANDPHAGLSMPGLPSRPGAGAPPPAAEGEGAPDATPSPFTWIAPAEWKRRGALPMRLATYVPKDATRTEIAVSTLPGRAGGARLNVERWRTQMGLATPLQDAEYAALRRSTILGAAAVFLEVDGRYGGMSGAPGAEPIDPARMVAVAIEREKGMVFVKMTGPADEVRREEARFLAFCESLRE